MFLHLSVRSHGRCAGRGVRGRGTPGRNRGTPPHPGSTGLPLPLPPSPPWAGQGYLSVRSHGRGVGEGWGVEKGGGGVPLKRTGGTPPSPSLSLAVSVALPLGEWVWDPLASGISNGNSSSFAWCE